MEVVGFSPGKECDEVNCVPPQFECVYDGKQFQPGEDVYQGCQDCRCEADGQWTCK